MFFLFFRFMEKQPSRVIERELIAQFVTLKAGEWEQGEKTGRSVSPYLVSVPFLGNLLFNLFAAFISFFLFSGAL